MKNKAGFVAKLSIKTKLVLIIVFTSLFVLLLAGSGFVLFEHRRVEAEMRDDLASLARVVANRSTVALSFNDAGVARSTLMSLSVKESVIAACIYDGGDKLFASYNNGWNCADTRAAVTADAGYLDTDEPIAVNGEILGRVFIRASLQHLESLLQKWLLLSASIIFVAGLIALLLASWLQRLVSGPLERLKQTVETITEQKNYTVRARQESDDELGALVRAFNVMIGAIEARDQALQTANQQLAYNEKALAHSNEMLEERVAERTAELADSHAKQQHYSLILATVLDSMSQGLIAFDKDLKLLFWNKKLCDVRGYPTDMLAIGRDLADFFAFDLSDRSVRYYASETDLQPYFDDLRQCRPHRFTAQRLDGKVIEISGGPIADGGFVSTYEDVTLRTQAEAALRQARNAAESANQTKSQFLANMSHELRTPMNGVLGMLHLALQTELTQKQHNYLAKAHNSARTLLGILNDILDFSKIEAGKLSLETAEFRFETVLEQVIDLIGYEADQKGLEFLIRQDPGIPSLMVGDSLRLGQILINLCGNALKFTTAGELELNFQCLSQTEGNITLQVAVRDTGIGIAVEDQHKLFQEFTQADQGTSRRFGGTGLGLAICKKLVELMHGRIWIEDSQLGKGSTFCFTVQLGLAKDAGRRLEELEQKVGQLLAGIRVLVVDDNRSSQEIMRELLVAVHMKADCVDSGPAAIAALHAATDPYDLLLMDWKMPGMTGDEAVRLIRTDKKLSVQPKIVMATAYGSEEVVRLSERAGIDGFLLKPVSPSSLLDTILLTLGRGHIEGAVSDYKQSGSFAAPDFRPLQGVKILLVEDNEINREFATELLISHGLIVEEAVNGRIAIEKVLQNHYDAVLMDIQMPVLDGLAATREIRALAGQTGEKRYRQLPIIAMTAHAMVSDVEKSLEAGMNDHIVKPIDPVGLLSVLTTWLPERQVAVSGHRTLPPSAEPAWPDDLSNLPSLDIVQGIRRIGGNAAAYRKQLRRFIEHYADIAAEIRQLVAADELLKAEERCHALKGLSGNLGATELFQAAAEIDALLQQGLVPNANLLDNLARLLSQVVAEIAALAQCPVEAAAPMLDGGRDFSPAAATECLQRLQQALDNDLGAVEALVGELQQLLTGSPHAEVLEIITAEIDRFALDDAQRTIAALRAALQT